MTTNLIIFFTILILAGISGFALHSKMKAKGEVISSITEIPELLLEYSAIIKSFIDDTIKVLSIDKTISKDDFINIIATSVSEELYNEIQSEDDLKNTVVGKLSASEIQVALVSLFTFSAPEFNIDTLYNTLTTASVETSDNTSETVSATDIKTEVTPVTNTTTDTTDKTTIQI